MIDLLIVLAFIAYAITAGFRARGRASRGLDEYFLAGRTLSGWRAGTSMAATQFAADTPLLVTGLIATGGIFLVWRLWIYGLAFLVMAFIFSALWRRAGVLTDAELTEIRYSGRGVLPLRVLKAVYYGTVINCVVMAMVLVAAVRIAEVFLPWHAWLPTAVYAVPLGIVQATGATLTSGVTGLDPAIATTDNLLSIVAILGFTALYSTTGGLRSVVTTDVAQFGVAMAGTAVYAYVVLRAVGGFRALGERTVELYGAATAADLLSFSPSWGDALLPFAMLIGLQWLFQTSSDGTGYLAQRSMACATDRDARIAGVVFVWLQIFARSMLWLVIGVGLLVLYPYAPGATVGDGFVATREMLFVTGIDELLPVGVRGLMLTGLLAALASTLDTHLNWGASYWSNDIYRRLVCGAWLKRDPGDRELVVVARLSTGVILLVALVIMANLGSIQAAWYLSLLFGAGMGSVLVLRWLWERINLYSELAAIVTSLVIAPILLVVTQEEWIRIAAMGIASTIAAVGVTWFTPRTEPEVLTRFYRRVDPAGFWRRTAAAAGEDPAEPLRRLRAGLGTAGVTALSLFALLVGVGRFVVPVPGGSVLLPWGLILGGLALVPFWWRGVVRAEPLTAPAESALAPAGGEDAVSGR